MESKGVNDTFYVRLMMESEHLILALKGDPEAAVRASEQATKHAQAHHQRDMHHARYLGNLGELLYNKARSIDSMRFFKDGRIQAWL